MVIQGSFSAASCASFESKETTDVLLDALHWIEIIASMSIPALSNPTMISWLVTNSSTEKVRECYFLIFAFCPSNFYDVNATFWKLWPACWRSLITPGSWRAWTDALVEFSGGELVDEQEKYKTGVAHDSPITPSWYLLALPLAREHHLKISFGLGGGSGP